MNPLILIPIYLVIGIFLAFFIGEVMNQKSGNKWQDDEVIAAAILLVPFFWGAIVLALPVAVITLPILGIKWAATYSAKELVSPRTNVKEVT